MAENEFDEFDEGNEKKSSKLMMIIIAVVLLLAGGGAGFYFMTGDSAEIEGEAIEQIEDAVEEDEDEDEDEEVSEEVYYDLGKPLIVNFPKGSEASLIQVSVSLLVKNEATVEALQKHEPMIRNNLLMAISDKGSANLMIREGKEALRAEMLKEIGDIMEKMTGKNKVIDVFFTSFVMQ